MPVLGQMSEGVERVEEALPAERPFSRVMGGLLSGEGVESFLKCVREGLSVDVVRVPDCNVQIGFCEAEVHKRRALSKLK